jgi:polar amino acid transport system substrate-binding protein
MVSQNSDSFVVYNCHHPGKTIKGGEIMFSRFLSLFALILICSAWQIQPARSQLLTLYTEEFPPFNMTENGKITGVSTAVVEAVMGRSGLQYTIQSYPWARTYKLAQSGATSIIYSISRRAKRENLFKWVGIIVPSVQSVFALKSNMDVEINELADMKKFEIGTVQEDARETFLLNKGFTESDLQRTSGDNAYLLNYRKLKKGRIDLWPMPDAVAFHIVKKAGDDPTSTIRKVFEFKEMSKGGYYIAASPNVPDRTVKTIRVALEAFKKTKEYKGILTKWGLGP